VFFFRLRRIYREGEGPTDRNLAGDGQWRGLHASLDPLYRIVRAASKSFEVHAFPLALLPRRCPRCGRHTIIGHGQRRKQAHE
jgi:hypothetical protein